MSDDFKKKLEAYQKGELSDSELEAFENELERLETYQEYLEENEKVENNNARMKDTKRSKILRRGKWKARFQTAFFALGLFLIFTIVSSVLTAIYYSWGTPDRSDVYRNIIDYTLTITDPNGYIGGTSTGTKPYFGLEATRDLNKRVGDETKKVGEWKINFIFSLMGIAEPTYFGNVPQNKPGFTYPGVGDRGMSDWNKLEKLPEGTVASAYISFTELLDTEKVFELLEGRNMDLQWLVVDTGLEATDEWYDGIVFEPIGFPSFPIWHEDDMIVTSREEEKGRFGSKIVSESSMSPDYQEGESSILHKQFLKTLYFLKDYERKANNLYFGKLKLEDRIQFLEKNGVLHYGMVVTGPSKELLKLQKESWISALEVDEVGFWNWDR